MSLADSQVSRFERNMIEVLQRLQAEIIASANKGMLFSGDNALRLASAPDMFNELIGALDRSGYSNVVNAFTDEDIRLVKDVKAARATAGLPTAFTQQSAETLSAFKTVEFEKFQSLGNGFIESMRQELIAYISTGTNERDFINKINSMLNDNLKRYATTYATTSRQQVIQQIQNAAAANYDGELYWEYVGPEDDRMRDACAEGIEQRYFTDAERIEFEERTAGERAWNCRHVFVQITEETYKENTGGSK